MSDNNHSTKHPILKILASDSALAMYIKTNQPRFLWSFLFAMITLVLFIVFGFYFYHGLEKDFNTEMTRTILKFIITGSISMSLSRAFIGDIRGFLGLLVAGLGTMFIYQFA